MAALSASLAYVGAGLDGPAGLGDFDLQLNDDYQGRVVKGCTAYNEVRQLSMDGFGLEKYQGKWYEQKFHNWTQLKDSTTRPSTSSSPPTVKGPALDSAKLLWDKIPVVNGAHYFLFGRVDKDDPPGVLCEKRFGVEFPNYIVEVKKDPETGECTRAGGVGTGASGGDCTALERTPERTPEQTLERTPERSLERTLERTPEESLERTAEWTPERSPEQTL